MNPHLSTILDALAVESDAKEAERWVKKLLDRVRTEGYPLYEDESTAVLLYFGRANSVALMGDMTQWAGTLPFEKAPAADLFVFRGRYEPDARLEYVICVDGLQNPMPDPLNPRRVHGFLMNSELPMPRYQRIQLFDPFLDGTRGSFDHLQEFQVDSVFLGYPHLVHVQLPPGYRTDVDPYPVIYFQDGSDYVEYAAAPVIVEHLIRSGDLRPCIAVFITPPNRRLPDEPNRTTEYGMNDAYVRFVAEELVTFIDARFNTLRSADARLVVGDSYAGLFSLYLAWSSPQVFRYSCSQSGYCSFRNDALLHKIQEAPARDISLHIDCGTYERKVGFGWLPAEEGDFLEANRRMVDMLRRKGYPVLYREYPEGHTWGNWRAHLLPAITHFFGQAGH